MDSTERIENFAKFIQKTYFDVLSENIRKGKNFLVIDFRKLTEFNYELADCLLAEPEETLKAAELSLEAFDLPRKVRSFQFQVNNISDDCRRLISSKRTADFGKLHFFEGIIRAKGHVLSRAEIIKYECPSCGNVLNVMQDDRKKTQPTRCGCGRKGKFRVIGERRVDIQKLELEELPENVKGTSQPQRLKAMLKKWLVDPKFEAKFNPGAKVRITGVLQEIAILLRNGAESVDSDFILDACFIENIEEEDVDSEISGEEIELIREIADREDCVDVLVKSLVPSIYGHDMIKEGVLVQLVGGVRKIAKDGTVKRGDIHVLVIGDPGAGKSTILKRVEVVIPHARVATGKGSSGVGLTAAVVRDEFLGWTFQAGTLVLAHKNVAIIDEFDKMTKEDRDQIHEALEQQTVTIAKAQVQARLSCECAVLAGANPKYGRFDPYGRSLADQIDLPPTIINRFDLIFPVTDVPKAESDKLVAGKILDVHTGCVGDDCEDVVETGLLRKYLNHAKALMPSFTKGASDHLIKYYLKIRGKSGGEEGSRVVPISARQLEGLIRLSEGYAKLRLSNRVSVGDAQRAIDLMDYCLKQVAFDEEAGVFDIDKLATGYGASFRTAVSYVNEAFDSLEKETGKMVLLIDDVVVAAVEKGAKEPDVKKAFEDMRRKGDIFYPKNGYVSRA